MKQCPTKKKKRITASAENEGKKSRRVKISESGVPYQPFPSVVGSLL